MADEENGDEVEMTPLGQGKDNGTVEVKVDSYRPVVERQNCCFGFGLLSCAAAAVVVYFVAGVYVGPSFTTGQMGVDDYDSSSGKLGLGSEDAKSQGLAGEGAGVAHNKKHWGDRSNPMNWWTNGAHIGPNQGGKEKDWVRNHSYWRDHPNIDPFDKDKLDHLQTIMKSNWTKGHYVEQAGKDGICTLASGRKVPCSALKQPSDEERNEDDNDVREQPLSETKITLEDGKQFEVLEQMYHDPKSFTQGLTYADGKLFESTGLYGKSKVRQLDPKTGDLIKSVDMDANYFGEGMTYYDKNRLIQITWKNKKGFIYDSETLTVLDEFDFSTTKNEGWGITFDSRDRTFIVSDGSSFLHFWDADVPGVDKIGRPKVQVIRQNGQPARDLNELEFVNGKVIANVWYQDVILVIDPKTGVCEKEYDFSSLWPQSERRAERADVLNGVSLSGEKGVLFVTGKLWNRMFKVKLNGMDEVEQSG